MKKIVKSSYIIFFFIFLLLGYMIAFSYQEVKQTKKNTTMSNSQYERDLILRNELIDQEQHNLELQKELKKKQDQVFKNEKELSNEAHAYSKLVEEAERYRMYLGKVKVKGEGIQVTLEDGNYNPEKNANQYIVHEQHVFKVVNELYISGAAAVAINGQRLSHSSYILCNGPVIEIDGFMHPAPFVITAIGDANVLSSAINIPGGIKDSIVNDNIQFTVEKKDEIVLNPLLAN
ncbi:DUF881 domain-containing protein [Bacillus sp. 03113]|uniref:DUF881 domain-containing protein n=1 Tax=Bacillus sp. 03113 TaxID=2578211 RepID=UPI0037C10A56